MYHHLCLPTDGSALSEHAIEQALILAKTLHARVTAVFVTQPYHVFAVTPEQMVAVRDDYERETRDAARHHLRSIESRAHAASVPCDSVVVEDESPYQAIIAIARERGCDLIAMASHGHRGIKAMVLGSETQKVLTHSSIPVLVYRPGN
ncbi:universal stress protein [Lysobacter panacisoli]|uniref:Universal stress protein n=1 Tax=Lysobacter panacisoli TaxID=1255263 RepID=A0ABP9L1X3_9GAMM|nr:universal stress protein [Lysobacter panacisoli]